MTPSLRRLAGPLLAAALLPCAGVAAPGAAAPPAEPPGHAVAKGAVVSVDLSRLPSRVTRKGSATCLGVFLAATGANEEVPCQRAFSFDMPPGDAPLVVLFRPKGGGAPTRHEFPSTWDPRPQTFTAPAAGTVAVEPAAPETAPRAMPPEVLAKARAAAAAACGECRGGSDFALQDFTVEAAKAGRQGVTISIQPPAAP